MSVSSLNLVINPGLSVIWQIGLLVRLVLSLEMPPKFVSFAQQNVIYLWCIEQGSALVKAACLTLSRMSQISVANVLLQLEPLPGSLQIVTR